MKKKLLEVFRRTFDPEIVNEETSRINCENWDSLNHLRLSVLIEKEFEIYLEPEEINSIKDFSDAEQIVAKKLLDAAIQ